MNTIKPYHCLSEQQQQEIHAIRLNAHYSYRKPICKALNKYMSLDETYYYNRFLHQ